MAQHGKPWHVCDDCVDPLADDLFALAQRFRKPFDVAKRDRLDCEYRQIIESGGWDDNRLTSAQKKRLAEVAEQLRAQAEPPSTQDVWAIYKRYKIDLATDWLKFNVSVDYANNFKRTLVRAQKRFSDLDFKACQIINGDIGNESTTGVRYAIPRLIDRHYGLLRAAYPDREDYPDRENMPDELRAFEIEILDEYWYVENEFRETVKYLRHVSALVRSKLAKADKHDQHLQKQFDGIGQKLSNLQSLLPSGDVADTRPQDEQPTKPAKKTRQSTPKGQAHDKIITALTKHHQYADDSCLNSDPIGVNELAEMAEVGSASVSRFFVCQFNENNKTGGAYHKYEQLCRDNGRLIPWLKVLNREGLGRMLLGENAKHIADD